MFKFFDKKLQFPSTEIRKFKIIVRGIVLEEKHMLEDMGYPVKPIGLQIGSENSSVLCEIRFPYDVDIEKLFFEFKYGKTGWVGES